MLLLLRFLHFYSKVKLVSYSVLIQWYMEKNGIRQLFITIYSCFSLCFRYKKTMKRRKIGGQRILWLKFLVLISFLSFAGFFDNPALDTKAHDHFRHETRDKYQSWKESKIGPTPTSENKMKNWGSIRPPSPTTRASIRWYLKVINLGRKPKTIPSSPSTNTPALSLTKLSTLWYKHLLIQLNKFTVQSFFSTIQSWIPHSCDYSLITQ